MVDEHLCKLGTMTFEGGTHRETIKMLLDDFVTLEKPLIARISKENRLAFNAPTDTPRLDVVTEFSRDQRRATELLRQVSTHLAKGRYEEARLVADELNRIAGPLIRYEKLDLYPRLSGQSIHSDYTIWLSDRQRNAGISLRTLLVKPALTSSQQLEVTRGLHLGLEYMQQCSGLAGLLASLPNDEREASLNVLLNCREEGRSWTDLVRFQN